MKRLACVVLAMFGSMSTAHSATEFYGAVCATSVTKACTDQGWQVDSCFTSRFAPLGVGDNGARTQFSLFSGQFAIGFMLFDTNPVSTKPIVVNAAKVARGGYTLNMGFRFVSQSPAVPTSSTKEITVAGVFTDWDEIPGCTMNFRGSFTRRN